MRYSVCIIDNDIPAAGPQAQNAGIKDSELLNASNLQFLINNETWTDDVIKSLVQTLLTEKAADGISPKWDLFAFTNPAFYINAIDDGFFRPDLIVFDWEYPGGQAGSGTDSESLLKQILDRTFSLVFIFSKADKKDEIEAIVSKPEFLPYRERVEYLDKTVSGLDQSTILLQNAEQRYANNFSFKFASLLRKKSVQSVDKILSDMGKASLNDVKNHVIVGHDGKKDFVDFMTERFRASLAGKEIHELVDQILTQAPGSSSPSAELAAKVWSYRLYFRRQVSDDLVRRGDIVKTGTEYSMILSADCDLGRFWNKNLGIINTVILHEIKQSNTSLKDWLTLCVKPDKIPDPQIKHLLANIGALADGPFVLPFVPMDDEMKNFIAIPKDLKSIRINFPTEWNQLNESQKIGKLKEEPMKYSYWSGTERVCTVAEPFLTPVIQHVLSTMLGNGVPDYPPHMKGILKEVLEDFTAPAAAPTATLN